MLQGKSILLIIGGGIAAYKSLELIRELKKRGCGVKAILTRAAKEFVTPLSVASLSGEKVYDELFSLTDEVEMGHIQLSRAADLLVVAPATADLMAKMMTGQANDLATTALLATDKRVLIAPAMNVRMWDHPATQRNLAQLRADGVLTVGPNEGEMACGEFGPGRMAEPLQIVAAIEAALAPHGGTLRETATLAGKRVLVTSGPTHEPIDPVRYIANRSSGKQGHAIAAAAAQAGARVTLISGPVRLDDPAGVTTIHVESAREMLAAVTAALPADIAIFAAAVADWRVDAAPRKLKKTAGKVPAALTLTENPDILATVSGLSSGRPALVVGFAAETDDVVGNARAKLARKSCDMIVANDVSREGSGIAGGVFGADVNVVHIVTKQDVVTWPQLPKDEVARRLIAHIAALHPALV